VGLAIVIATLGRLRHSLSPSGAVAAVVVGAIVVAGGGWWAGGLLVLFFVTSSVLSRTGRARGTAIAARSSERDAVQVFANGGIAALGALGALLASPSSRVIFIAGISGAIAAATADTWATELGRASRTAPRLITSGVPVPPGLSGGITPLGTLASLAGAVLIAMLASLGAWLGWQPTHPAIAFGGVVAAGFTGGLLDSLLGATVQVVYHCPNCNHPTESLLHTCGTPTIRRRGIPFVTNDLVNVAATLAGGAIAALIIALTL
jgi:uncharacterized protein (TIGR00297 family)